MYIASLCYRDSQLPVVLVQRCPWLQHIWPGRLSFCVRCAVGRGRRHIVAPPSMHAAVPAAAAHVRAMPETCGSVKVARAAANDSRRERADCEC